MSKTILQEPEFPPAGTPRMVLQILQKSVLLLLLLPLALMCGVAYGLVRIFAARPPNIPSPKTVRRYFLKTLYAHPEVAVTMQISVLLNMLIFLSVCPLFAGAWYLDDVLYPKYRRTLIQKPLFLITGSRSGSTQLSQYLEDNPQIVSHPLLQQSFPYIWMWKLLPRLLGRWFPEDKLTQMVSDTLRAEFLQRKEMHPFKPETYEVIFSASQLVNHCIVLGPQMFAEGYGWGQTTPENAHFWEEDLVNNIDAVGKKMLYFAGPNPDGSAKTLLIKGHFLGSATRLEQRYPDAHFLTILRHPSPRIRSIINFFRVAPEVCSNGAIPWSWLVHYGQQVEVNYCLYEKQWYEARPDNTTVLRFREYVSDIEETLRTIYQRCLPNVEMEGFIIREHTPRKRTGYSVDRSYEQMNIDEQQLLAPLQEYIDWVESGATR